MKYILSLVTALLFFTGCSTTTYTKSITKGEIQDKEIVISARDGSFKLQGEFSAPFQSSIHYHSLNIGGEKFIKGYRRALELGAKHVLVKVPSEQKELYGVLALEDADERGFGKFEQQTTLNFPSLYGFTPTAQDFVVFDELILNKDNQPSNVPVYQVVNKEKATNTWLTFWKINLKIRHYKKDDLELQVRDVFSFVDYEKQIYHINTATQMYRMLELNSNLSINQSFKENIGYYIGI